MIDQNFDKRFQLFRKNAENPDILRLELMASLWELKETLGEYDKTKVGAGVFDDHCNVFYGFNRLGEARTQGDNSRLHTHAEKEAIECALRTKNELDSSPIESAAITLKSIYVTKFPCEECAKLIVAADIKELVCIEPYASSRWYESQTRARKTLEEHGVSIIEIEQEALDSHMKVMNELVTSH